MSFKAEFNFLGRRLRLSVHDAGFTLWDELEGRWVLDAFLDGTERQITMSNELRRLDRFKWDKPTFEAVYPSPKPQRSKKTPQQEGGNK